MNAAKRFLIVAVTFALATLVFTIANPKAVHAFAATLVQVVNTPSNPVPVAGTLGIDPNGNSVQLANIGSVKVLQQGGLNALPTFQVGPVGIDPNANTVQVSSLPAVDGMVGIQPGANVSVSNKPDLNGNPIPLAVRDVDNPARQPFFAECVDNTAKGQCVLTTVPAGKRLVIEMVEFDFFNLQNAHLPVHPFLSFTTAGVQQPHQFEPAVPSGFDAVLAKQVRYYADPSTDVLALSRDSQEVFVSGVYRVSGYFVDVP